MKKNKLKNPYREEAVKKWGKEAVEKSETRLLSLSKTDFQKLAVDQADNWKQLFELRDQDPEAPFVQKYIQSHYKITSDFWARKPDATSYLGLAELYLKEPRYTKVEGKYYKDFAEFLYKAIKYFIQNNL